MSALVIDGSVAIKWFVPEPFSEEARMILTAYRDDEIALYAPDLIHAEIGNILWKKQRSQGLAEADANKIVKAFMALRFTLTSCADLLEDAFRLAVTHNRTLYDSLYLALCLRRHCLFVTADERLANALHSAIPSVTWLPDWTPS